jgi:hypothetical protein
MGLIAWSIGAGVLIPIASQVDFNARFGLRHVGGLAQVDQCAGTGLADIQRQQRAPDVPDRRGRAVPVQIASAYGAPMKRNGGAAVASARVVTRAEARMEHFIERRAS